MACTRSRIGFDLAPSSQHLTLHLLTAAQPAIVPTVAPAATGAGGVELVPFETPTIVTALRNFLTFKMHMKASAGGGGQPHSCESKSPSQIPRMLSRKTLIYGDFDCDLTLTRTSGAAPSHDLNCTTRRNRRPKRNLTEFPNIPYST